MTGFIVFLIVVAIFVALVMTAHRVRHTLETPEQQAVSPLLPPFPTEFDNLSQDEEALIFVVMIECGINALHYAGLHKFADQSSMREHYQASEKCKRDRRALIALFAPDLSESERNAVEIKIILLGNTMFSSEEISRISPRIWQKHQSSVWYGRPFVDC